MSENDSTGSRPRLPNAEWLMGTEDEVIDFAALRQAKTKGLREEVPSTRQPEATAATRSQPSSWATDFLLNQVAGTRADIRPRQRRAVPAEAGKPAVPPSAPPTMAARSEFDRRRAKAAPQVKPPDPWPERSIDIPRPVRLLPSSTTIVPKLRQKIAGRRTLQAATALALLGGVYGLSANRPHHAGMEGTEAPADQMAFEPQQTQAEPKAAKPWLALPSAVAAPLPPGLPVRLASASDDETRIEPAASAAAVITPGAPVETLAGTMEAASIAEPAVADLVVASKRAGLVPAPRRSARIETAPAAAAFRQPVLQATARTVDDAVAAIEPRPASETAASGDRPASNSSEVTKSSPPQIRIETGKPMSRASARMAHTTPDPSRRPSSRATPSVQRQAFSLPAALRPTPF